MCLFSDNYLTRLNLSIQFSVQKEYRLKHIFVVGFNQFKKSTLKVCKYVVNVVKNLIEFAIILISALKVFLYLKWVARNVYLKYTGIITCCCFCASQHFYIRHHLNRMFYFICLDLEIMILTTWWYLLFALFLVEHACTSLMYQIIILNEALCILQS